MALKDWKRLKLKREDSKLGSVVYNKEGEANLIIYEVKNAGWFVDLDTASIGTTLKITKSKSQALSYAKQYMRTH